MKHIKKEEEPIEFIDWKKQGNKDWQPTYENLSHAPDVRKSLFHALFMEQGGICCYCEQELQNDGFHMEHFKPKDANKFPELQLDYENLLCSCQRNLKKGAPRHCGSSKGNWFEEERLISPLHPECEIRFKYTADGGMYPIEKRDIAAQTTISQLCLNIDKLKSLRKAAIEPFLELNADELRAFVSAYLCDKSDNNGLYNAFFTTISYLFKN